MGLIKNRNLFKISPTDKEDGYLSDKIVGGENVEVIIEQSIENGEQLIFSANKVEVRKIQYISADATINPDVFLVKVDASKNHVVLTLPYANQYKEHLQIVCVDASCGIQVVTHDEKEVIFDQSNLQFHAKGDAFTLITDHDNTWFVVGRYNSQWYA